MKLRPTDAYVLALTETEASVLTLALRNLVDEHGERDGANDRTADTGHRILLRLLEARES